MDGSEYVSCIYIGGKPIPGPVMDKKRRMEMQEYKKQALIVERRITHKRTELVMSKLDALLTKLEEDSKADTESIVTVDYPININDDVFEESSQATYMTLSTDISPYMQASNSTNIDVPNDNEDEDEDDDDEESVADSSLTVLNAVTPHRIRKNSYTVEAPSPALLKSVQSPDPHNNMIITEQNLLNHRKDDNEDKQMHVKLYLDQLCPTTPDYVVPEPQSSHRLSSSGDGEIVNETTTATDQNEFDQQPIAATTQSSDATLNSTTTQFDNDAFDEQTRQNFSKLPALVKGHLTRKLMKSHMVQSQIQTIKDTLMFALMFQSETDSVDRIEITAQDVALHRRLISQVTTACHQLHHIFFEMSKTQQIALIRQSYSNTQPFVVSAKPKLSSATVKYRARKSVSTNLNGFYQTQRKATVRRPSSRNISVRRRLCSASTKNTHSIVIKNKITT